MLTFNILTPLLLFTTIVLLYGMKAAENVTSRDSNLKY